MTDSGRAKTQPEQLAERWDEFLDRVRNGETTSAILEDWFGKTPSGTPPMHIAWNLIDRDDEMGGERREEYARARQIGSHVRFELVDRRGLELLAGGIDAKEAHAIKVGADLLKWSAAKLNPKDYGEKIDLGKGGQVIAIAFQSHVGLPGSDDAPPALEQGDDEGESDRPSDTYGPPNPMNLGALPVVREDVTHQPRAESVSEDDRGEWVDEDEGDED